MIVRDLDVLVEAATRAPRSASSSRCRRSTRRSGAGPSPGRLRPRRRLEALTRLVEAGVKAGVGMAPILPGISDSPEQLEAVVRAAREAGATERLGERPLPQAGHARALPRGARAATGPRSSTATSACTRRARTCRRRRSSRSAELVAEPPPQHGIRDRRPVRLEPPPPAEQLALASDRLRTLLYDRPHARDSPRRRDHLPDRRRPRGRPRGPPPLALARVAHPRDRRGVGRRAARSLSSSGASRTS